MTTYLRPWILAILLVLFLATPGLTQKPDGETAKPRVSDDPASTETPAEQAPTDEAPMPKEEANSDDPESTSDSTERETEPEETVPDEQFLQNPFSYLQSDMQSATVDLKEGVTRPPAKVTQPRILKGFDLLIEELERQGQGAGQAGQRVNRPAQQSSLMRGPGGQNEMRAPRDDGRDWADLSPQERQKILQSRTDGFPAGYDEILADYFRRVARAQETAAPAADDEGTTEPAIDNDSGSGSN